MIGPRPGDKTKKYTVTQASFKRPLYLLRSVTRPDLQYSIGLYCINIYTIFIIFDSTATCQSWQVVNYNIQVDTVFTLQPEEPWERFTILTEHCTAPETRHGANSGTLGEIYNITIHQRRRILAVELSLAQSSNKASSSIPPTSNSNNHQQTDSNEEVLVSILFWDIFRPCLSEGLRSWAGRIQTSPKLQLLPTEAVSCSSPRSLLPRAPHCKILGIYM